MAEKLESKHFLRFCQNLVGYVYIFNLDTKKFIGHGNQIKIFHQIIYDSGASIMYYTSQLHIPAKY